MPSYCRFDSRESASLQNVRLPDKIRCDRCQKWKAPSNFSKRRLNELKKKIVQNGQGSYASQCTVCTPRQNMEMACYMCGKDKGLDGFSKQQRKNPDRAKCNICMNQQLTTEPVEGSYTYHGEELGSSSDSDDSSDDDYGSIAPIQSGYAASNTDNTTSGNTGTGNLVGNFDGLSVGDTSSTTTDGFYTPFKDRSVSGQGRPLGRGASYAASVASTSTSAWNTTLPKRFDEKAYGHPGAPSVADSLETNQPASSAGSKWAKVKAYKPMPKDQEEEDPWEGEDEESSEDDESDDGYKA